MDIDKDLEYWMTNLPQHLKTFPFMYLAIPGSHDSITYGITRESKVSPDADSIIQKLKFLGPILRMFMVGWAKTQALDVTQQLKGGIRYFDFRIATKPKYDKFYFVHGLYSNEVKSVLEEINAFLDTHPKEVVIMDCQHFYAFQKNDHERLMLLLTSTFGQKLVPYEQHMDHLTLQHINIEHDYQAIVIYRADAARFGQPLLWSFECFPTPWPDTDIISKLINFLTTQMKFRNNSYAYVSQCVLTPSVMFVVKHLLSSLKQQCFLPLENEKYKWLRKQQPGRSGVNIIISDFVGYQDDNFAREVIKLNTKLLSSAHINQVSSTMTPVDK